MKPGLQILLVEDDNGHAQLATRNLKRAGLRHDLRRFADGQELLDFLFAPTHEDGPIPGRSYLLLLDIRMPRVDGIEVLRRLKADRNLRRMPVIMVSTSGEPETVERCHDLGCSAYINKPIRYEDYVAAVECLAHFLDIVVIPPLIPEQCQ